MARDTIRNRIRPRERFPTANSSGGDDGDHESTTTFTRRSSVFLVIICFGCRFLFFFFSYLPYLALSTVHGNSASAAEPLFTRTYGGGEGPRRVESKRPVCVYRRWRGAANRLAAAVCRCRTRPNRRPVAPRQSPFEPFPAHREQLLWRSPPDPADQRGGKRAKNRIPPRAAARAHTDVRIFCWWLVRVARRRVATVNAFKLSKSPVGFRSFGFVFVSRAPPIDTNIIIIDYIRITRSSIERSHCLLHSALADAFVKQSIRV